MSRFSLSFILITFAASLFPQSKISNQSGDWSDPTTWTPNGVPTSTNDVTISNGHTINFEVNGICNSLVVGTGAAAIFRYSGGTARTLTVNTNITVNNLATFRIRASSNETHTLNIRGNIINNGTFDLRFDANSVCNVIFSNNGNQTVSGTGATTEFNLITVNMGTSVNNVVDIISASFITQNNFLQLSNGTFKVSTPNAVSIVPFTALATIPANAGLWVNSANAVVSSSAGINLSGLIRVSNGILNIGNAANEDLAANAGTFALTGGSVNIAGKYNASSAAINYSMTGGVLTVPTVGSTNTSLAPFHLSAATSQFNMSGGQIVIQREGGTGAQDLGFTNTGSTAGIVSGGTLQIGNTSTPASQIIRINASYPVGNLHLNSANATAMVTTNSLNVTGNILFTSGTLNDNNLNIELSGNWTNNGGTYSNTNGRVIFNSSSAQSIFKSGGETFNHLEFTGSGLKTFASAITAKGFTINSGAAVDVSSSNFQLSLSSNFSNNGSLVSRAGLVLLNGSAAQSIGGTSITDFFNLTLNNTTGANLSGAENILGTLTLNNGTFNTNAQVFTMVSTATATARVAQITGSGDISGDVTVQRFIPGGTTGWALLGTPLSSAQTLQDWDDDIFISCGSCPDGSAAGFLSIYSYNETTSGNFDDPSAYTPLSGITDPVVFCRGMWVYLGTGQFTTTDITLDVTGSLRKNNQTIPLNYTNFGSTPDDGWNLIYNPYPSTISWNALRGVTSNLDNAFYVYNADLNGGLGAFASFVNGVSSPLPGAGGVDDNIPMGQAFYVHSTGAAVINTTESIKVANNPTFLKSNASAQANNGPSELRLKLTDSNQREDETLLYFQAGASDQFDAGYDAYKLPGTDLSAPSIALQKDSILFQINGITPINGTFTMSLRATTGSTGNYTIAVSSFSTFPEGACVQIFDKYTNTTTDLRSTDCFVQLFDTTSTARLVLIITLNNLTATNQVTQPNCSNSLGGEIVAQPNNSGPWNYFWRDQNWNLVKSSMNKSTADTLNQLNGGNFNLQVNTIGECDQHESTFTIQAITVPIAGFSCVDTLNLQFGNVVSFINTSSNSVLYNWDFGDGIGSSTSHAPVYAFALPGCYTVRLISESADACKDTATNKLVVIDNSTGIQSRSVVNDLLLKTLDNNQFHLIGTNLSQGSVTIYLYDGAGKLVQKLDPITSNAIDLKLNLNHLSKGIYFLNLKDQSWHKFFKLPVQ